MQQVVLVIHLMLVLALIGVVLLQRSEGGALGMGMFLKNCQKGSLGFICGNCGCSSPLTLTLPLTLMLTTAEP